MFAFLLNSLKSFIPGAGKVTADEPRRFGFELRISGTVLTLSTLATLMFIAGCGASGYAGDGIEGLSRSAITLDAGQSFPISATSLATPLVSWSMAGGACSASACGTLAGVSGMTNIYSAPSALASQLKVTLTAAIPNTQSSSSAIITVNPDPTIAGAPPAGTVGAPYTTTLIAANGTAPLKWSIAGGSLPDGLSFDTATGVISGTPNAVGSFTLSVQLTDSSYIPFVVTAAETVVVSAPILPLTVISGNPPAGTVGVPYSTALQASGGVGPYTWNILSGALPAGLTLSPVTGAIAGIPTAPIVSPFTAQAQDSVGAKASAPFSITIGAAPSISLALSTLPAGMVGIPYSATIGVTGGSSPYACSLTVGTLPVGLTLTGCVVSGIPTAAGTFNLTVKATDSSSPVLTTTGPESLTIAPAALTLTASGLLNGTVGVPYSATIGVTGGTSPYSCVFTVGALPAGLTLSGCVVSGTPTLAGTSSLTVKATDSSSPTLTTTGPETIAISPAPLGLTASSLPNGTVGVPYSATIGVNGGTSPYSCLFTVGTLPAGLSLTGCVVSGTPTIAGTSNLTVKATDSSSPLLTTNGPESITISSSPITLALSSPPNATVNTPYTGSIGVSGGTGPYSCAITVGTLPPGLTNTGCAITGTPTTAGSYPITVQATDSSSPAVTTTGPVTVTVNPASVVLTLSSPPSATVDTPYTGSIGVSGGSGPYSCIITLGSLPPGLTLTGCVLTGTPTTAGSFPITVQATDSSSPTATVTSPVTVTVNPLSPLTLMGSLPNAVVNVSYTQTLHAAGGLAPYVYTLTTGNLPAGLSLSNAGVISGTPTTVGASSFTVTVKDAEPTPQSASLPLVLLVTYPTTPNDLGLRGPYAFLFQGYDDALAGVLAYQTATAGSFTADGAGAVSLGELDANHQSSSPAGNTVSSDEFLGTYEVGSDNRGLLTITMLNSDGTTGATTTYAIALKAPVSPATISTQADMIEFDNNSLQGTKGSGTILAQAPSAFTTGLNGSYVFGLQGDTPCLPTCTLGIIAGPAAAVGQFTTNGAGAITTGQSDLNIATANLANESLGGTYGVADGNGRIQLSMSTAGTAAGVYPSDYAVYVVNANQAFLLSTDKHSAYILLAGSAQLQTQPTFSNASMTGPFIGYENSPTNPGLVGVVLQNTLNLSTATIFRATGDAAGTCNVTNTDVAGVTGLVNGLTGLGSGSSILNALLGTYQSTGSAGCTLSSDGRGVLNYPAPNGVLSLLLFTLGLGGNPPPPRVFYLASPDRGYFLETGYAGLGNLEPQTGTPFSLANTFTRTYVYGTAPASSLASINSSGIIQSNGAGQATSTLDLNVGVGTINVLQVGQTNTANYTTPDSTTGRFTYNGTLVLYAISPNRFVLLDTNPLTTSPSVSLLY